MNLQGSAERIITSIAQLSETRKPLVQTENALTRRLQRRFVRWCRKHKITLWRVPFDQIQWKNLVSRAIARKPPFSPFDPKGKSEKGFRDAIVLETLCQVCASRTAKRVIFLTADKLLASAAAERLGDAVTIYKEPQEYLSYLTLQRQNFMQQSITVLLEEAWSTFYKAADPESVYLKFDVPSRLQAEFPEEFSKTPAPVMPSFGGLSALIQETFTPTTNDGYRVEPTNVDRLDSKSRRMVFKTQVLGAKAFQSSNQFSPEQLRVISTKIFWSGKVRIEPEVAIEDSRLERLEFERTAFESATDERLKAFNLPTKLERLFASLPSPGVEPP